MYIVTQKIKGASAVEVIAIFRDYGDAAFFVSQTKKENTVCGIDCIEYECIQITDGNFDSILKSIIKGC